MRKWIVTIIIVVGMLGFSQSVNAGFFDWFKSILTSKAVERATEPILGDASLSEILKYNYTTGLTYLNTRLSQLLIGGTNSTTTNAKLEVGGDIHATGTISFLNEIKPDGDTCSNGQILKKTGTNDWDCAADSSGISSGTSSWEVAGTNLLTPTNTLAGIIVRGSSTIDNNLRVTGSVNATSSNIDSLVVNTAITVPDNSFALGTKTTGNYVATIADDGQSTITVNNSGSETAGVTLRVIDVVCTGCLGATEIAGLGVSDFSSANVSQWTNDAGYLTTAAPVGVNGLWETYASNVIRPTNTSAAILINAATSTIVNLRVPDHLFATTSMIDTLSVVTSLTVPNDSIALGTKTTGNYVATIADSGNSTISVSGSGSENAAVTLNVVDLNCTDCINATEIQDVYLLNDGDTGTGSYIFSGDARVATLNATSTNVGTLTAYGLAVLPDARTAMHNATSSNVGTLTVFTQSSLARATSTNLAVTSLNAASCDVMADTNGSFYCGTNGSGSTGGNGAWQNIFTNTLAPTNTSAGIFVYGSSTIDNNLRITGSLNATSSAIGTLNVLTGSTFPNNDITDAEVSDTLTASDLVAGSAVVADSEVVDALTINTSIEGVFSGGLRATPINSTSTNIGTLNVYTQASMAKTTTTNLGVTSLAVASCDVKATTAGDLYCGTDATASGAPLGINGAWESFGSNVLRPTNTSAAILVNAASSTITQLITNRATSTGVWVGSGGAAAVDMTNDLYVQDDVEIDGTLSVADAQITGGAITGITDLAVADGGTGASSLTDGGVLVGSGTGAITALSVGTNGQLLVGSTGADPVFATLNCAGNLTCTTGAGTLQIDVDDSFLLNTGDTGSGSYIFTGDARIATLNATTTNVGTLNAYGLSVLPDLRAATLNSTSTLIGTLKATQATTTNLAVLGMTAANCDVKATTDGVFYCGTDSGGAGSDMNSWQAIFTNALAPTNTSAGIFVYASSTFNSTLRVNGRATTSRAEIVDPTASSVVDTALTVIGNRVQIGPARYPANYVDVCPDCMYLSLDRATDVDDVSVVFRSQGNARAEIGLIGDAGANNLVLKTATGNYGSESFSSRMVITPEGNIGMGTTSPTHLLSVGTNNAFTVDYVGNVIASTSVSIGNLEGNGVLSVSGLQQSGGGSYIRVRDTVQGTYGYFGQNSVINGGTAYSQLSIQNPQASGTICLSAGGRASATAGTNCDLLFNSASSDIWFSGNARIPTLNSTTTNIDNLVINTTAVMPNGTGPTVSGVGKFALDTTSNQFLVATSSDAGGSPTVFGRAVSRLFGITVASSTPLVSGNTFDIGVDYDGFTVVRIQCFVKNGTSYVVNLTDGTNDTNTKTCTTTSGGDWATITTNAVWVGGEPISLEGGTNTGGSESVSVSIFGFITRK